jgi:Na+/H+ antiporter NhaD/arsenite permease-like protein
MAGSRPRRQGAAALDNKTRNMKLLIVLVVAVVCVILVANGLALLLLPIIIIAGIINRS